MSRLVVWCSASAGVAMGGVAEAVCPDGGRPDERLSSELAAVASAPCGTAGGKPVEGFPVSSFVGADVPSDRVTLAAVSSPLAGAGRYVTADEAGCPVESTSYRAPSALLPWLIPALQLPDAASCNSLLADSQVGHGC